MPVSANQFGRVPATWSGIVSRLDRSAQAVAFELCIAQDRKTGAAHIGMGRLAALTGLSESTVRRAVRRLAQAGLMSVTTGGGRKHTNLYRPKNPVTLGDTLSGEKACQTEAETLSKSTRNPVTQGDTRSECSECSEAHASAGGNAEAHADPVAVTFTAANGKPWQLYRSKLHELREAYPYVHVDSELDGIAAWAEANPNRRPRASGVWTWVRRLLARKQAERPLNTPAYYGDWTHASLPTDPTADELDAIFAEGGP